MTHRWMKFWPQDWQSDPGLRACSLAARGLWIECIAIMHRADRYGHLIVNGRPPSDRQLAGMVGASEREVSRLVSELEQAGVFSRDEAGVIFSRRMVRDHEQAKAGREAVSKRWDAAKTDQHPTAPPNTPPNRGSNRPPNSLEAEAEAETDTSLREVARARETRRGSRLPDGWTPSETDHVFAANLGLDAFAVAAQFRDYWHAKAGKDAVKLDWPATWRGWCRREAENRGRRSTGPARAPSPLSQWADLLKPDNRADLDGHAEEVFP